MLIPENTAHRHSGEEPAPYHDTGQESSLPSLPTLDYRRKDCRHFHLPWCRWQPAWLIAMKIGHGKPVVGATLVVARSRRQPVFIPLCGLCKAMVILRSAATKNLQSLSPPTERLPIAISPPFQVNPSSYRTTSLPRPPAPDTRRPSYPNLSPANEHADFHRNLSPDGATSYTLGICSSRQGQRSDFLSAAAQGPNLSPRDGEIRSDFLSQSLPANGATSYRNLSPANGETSYPNLSPGGGETQRGGSS